MQGHLSEGTQLIYQRPSELITDLECESQSCLFAWAPCPAAPSFVWRRTASWLIPNECQHTAVQFCSWLIVFVLTRFLFSLNDWLCLSHHRCLRNVWVEDGVFFVSYWGVFSKHGLLYLHLSTRFQRAFCGNSATLFSDIHQNAVLGSNLYVFTLRANIYCKQELNWKVFFLCVFCSMKVMSTVVVFRFERIFTSGIRAKYYY